MEAADKSKAVSMKKILIVVGTRPNFIKVTRFKKEAQKHDNIEVKIVHTGQHTSAQMAQVFFDQLELQPDFMLEIPQGSPNQLMAGIMIRLEELMTNKYSPDILLVVGDVNSTFAAALTANKLGIKVAHLESGLRSNDRSMPEEINRLLTDEIADYYFVTEPSGVMNLKEEGRQGQIFFVGNTMIDTLTAFEKEISESDVLQKHGLVEGEYVLMTIHRPSNVDFEEPLKKLVTLIGELAKSRKVVFPIHPRTRNNLIRFGLQDALPTENVILTEPMDYFAFQHLIAHCEFVLTDSGGIQEESTFRQIPCLTLRENTERPITISEGSNVLIPFDLSIILRAVAEIERGTFKKGQIPELWDGRATERILPILRDL